MNFDEICDKYYYRNKDNISTKQQKIIEYIYNGKFENNDDFTCLWIANYHKDVTKNYDEMLKYYLMAIEKSNTDAMNNLANYYQRIDDNYEEMMKYYLLAIKKGNVNAMNSLAWYYQSREKNYKEMKKYYLMAIDNGDIDAIISLAWYYQSTEKNYEEMKKYYLLAIENGNVNAMTNLGRYYENNIIDFYLKLLELQSNDLIENKINDLLTKYNYLKNIYVKPILK
jgi:hypothetical protein